MWIRRENLPSIICFSIGLPQLVKNGPGIVMVRIAPLVAGLLPVHYSCFSGKAADVPFAVFQELFQLLVRKCNRETRRKLAFPKELLLIDSTTMTVGKTRLSWAPYHGERAAVKLHVALRAQNGQPLGVTETIGARHDGPVCETLENPDFIMVMDRAYSKLERLDRYKQEGQSFVVRLRDNVHFEKPYARAVKLLQILRFFGILLANWEHPSAVQSSVIALSFFVILKGEKFALLPI